MDVFSSGLLLRPLDKCGEKFYHGFIETLRHGVKWGDMNVTVLTGFYRVVVIDTLIKKFFWKFQRYELLSLTTVYLLN